MFLEPKWTLELVSGSQQPPNELREVFTNGNGVDSSIREHSSQYLSNAFKSTSISKSSRTELPGASGALQARLVKNSRLTPATHWQDVRQLELVTTSEVNYVPGDTITIFPENFEEDVEHFLELMGWAPIADNHIRFKPTKSDLDFQPYPPPPISLIETRSSFTLRSLLLNHLDITAIPRRTFFSLIAHFTDDPMHKERLLEFTNPEYIDELYDYTTRPRRSILEVLQEFQSVKLPWQWIASVLPLLRGRQFSIASGGVQKHPETGGTRFELLVAIVKYRTVIKKIREGVCTRYLAALREGSHIDVLLQKGGLHITKAEASQPVVMIGPGTGVAPMRSLIWERLAWAEEMKAGHQTNGHDDVNNGALADGETVLFYGCRNREADYFYQDEWRDLETRIGLQVFTAFSRDQKTKIYVQDLVREQAQLVYQLLHEQSGIVYICGSSGRMPQAVREALIEVFERGGYMERDAAESYLLSMEKEGRYKQETW